MKNLKGIERQPPFVESVAMPLGIEDDVSNRNRSVAQLNERPENLGKKKEKKTKRSAMKIPSLLSKSCEENRATSVAFVGFIR